MPKKFSNLFWLFKGRFLVLLISVMLLALSTVGVVYNEGIISPFPKIDEDDRVRVFVTRLDCSQGFDDQQDHRRRPIVQVFSKAEHIDYFSSRIPGTISFSFDGFFEGCRKVLVDFGALGSSGILSAQLALYEDDAGAHVRYIARQREVATWREAADGQAAFMLPEDRDVAELDITFGDLLQRASATEFFFDGHFRFYDVLSSGHAQTTEQIGGTPARLVAIGLEQRTATANPYDGGALELVRTIWFGKLDAMNRLISTFLATMLGIWVGIILESILALTILREVRGALKEREKSR